MSDLDLLERLARRRSASNYFFIVINVVIMVASITLTVWLTSVNSGKNDIRGHFLSEIIIIQAAAFALVGITVDFYWLKEQRENYISHESLYRTLLSNEWQERGDGPLSRQWTSLGENIFRRSPVFFSKLEFMVPIMFVGVQATTFLVSVIAYLSVSAYSH